jgi:ABC-2 type transport system ATP-binding protein
LWSIRVIDATNLHKFFGDFHAVRGITLEVPPGEVLALLGPNGAGKSTTVRMLTAMVAPTFGTARIAGYDVVREPQHVRAQVGLLTEYPGLYGRMNALDYLLFFARLQGLDRVEAASRAQALLLRFGLWDAHARQLNGFSKGMQQKVALIRAMLHDPQILFLDEPTTAMDPQSARVVREAITDLRDERRVIVLCTHNLAEAEALADRIAVVRSGQIVAQGTPVQLAHRLLGEPIWELQAAGPLDAALDRLKGLIAFEQRESDRIRYRTSEPHRINPIVVDRLHATGVAVVALRELPRSLEDVYLQIVGEQVETPQEAPYTAPEARAREVAW